MKGIKKLFVNVLAVLMLVFSAFTMTACGGDVVALEVTLQVYNFAEARYYEDEEVKLTIEMQRHLAENTVDAITDYINDGYYDNAIFYLMEGYTTQLMIGQYKFDGENIVKNDIMPQLEGEFEYGSTKGSNLVNDEGYIGLWRSWYAQDDGAHKYKSSNGMESGRSTLYIPLDAISEYNGYFCVFGTIDYSISANDTGVNAVGAVLSSNYTTYVVYYTGEYDVNKPDEDYGLTFHCIPADDYNELSKEEQDNVFVAEGDQYVEYNMHRVRIPNKTPDGKSSAMIKSIKIK
jgi:cyclophilin family peptidyl-prolyl cis-trans isomerase